MTEQIPINMAATEQRLIEELTGVTTPVERHEADELRPGDPEPTEVDQHPTTD